MNLKHLGYNREKKGEAWDKNFKFCIMWRKKKLFQTHFAKQDLKSKILTRFKIYGERCGKVNQNKIMCNKFI